MSDTTPFGFGKFVPGFVFLQNLAKGASGNMAQMPNLSSWIAPTISIEDLDKRVQELKAVQFWLEQNSRALSATIQALEVQKMTLATLQGMNVSMGDVANAFKLKAADTLASGVQKATEKAASTAKTVADVASDAEDMARKVRKAAEPMAAAASNMIDPMQLWGALTQQFQTIAAEAMKEVSKTSALDATKNAASDIAKDAVKTVTDMAKGMAETATKTMTDSARAASSWAKPEAATPSSRAAPKAAAAKAPVAKKAAVKAAAKPKAPARKTTR